MNQFATTHLRKSRLDPLRLVPIIALLTCVGGPVAISAQSGPDVARAYREANEPKLVRDFAELLSV
jgi:ABC-type enterobactin transport system permease subunit